MRSELVAVANNDHRHALIESATPGHAEKMVQRRCRSIPEKYESICVHVNDGIANLP